MGIREMLQKGSAVWPAVAPFALLSAVMLALFFPFWGEGKVFLAADTLYDSYPWRGTPSPSFPPHGPTVLADDPLYQSTIAPLKGSHNPLITDPLLHNWTGIYNQELRQGWPSLWQPYILAGLPATEVTGQTGSPGRFYPLKLLLHRLLPPQIALMFLLMTHVLLMGFAMYLYLREIGAGREGALLGGAAYMLNGSLMVWLEFETIAGTGALLPLILLAQERWLGARRWLWAFLGALFLGLSGLMGQLQYVLYIALLMIFYQCFIMLRSWRRGDGWPGAAALLGCFAIAGTGGVLIAGVQLLPIADLVGNSARIGRTFDFAGLFDTLGRVPFRHFATLAFPYFFGGPPLGISIPPQLPTQEYMNFNELCLTMGIPALFLVTGALVGIKNSFVRFHLAVVLLIAAMMTGTWAYYPLFRFFPGMDRMNPIRISFLFVFACAAAAGLGWSAIGSLRGRRRVLFLAASGLLLTAILALGFLGGAEPVSRWFDSEIAASNAPNAPGILEMSRHLRSPLSPVIYPQMILACLAAAIVAVRVFAVRAAVRRGLFLLLFLLLGFEMISFGWGYNSFASPSDIYRTTPGIEFLRRQPGPFRVVQNSAERFSYNTLAHFGIQDLGGYSSFYPGRTKTFMSFIQYGEKALQGMVFDRWVLFSRGSPLMPLANVRYLLAPPGSGSRIGSYSRVFEGEIGIYEDISAMPRAFAVHKAVVQREAEALVYMNSAVFDMRREVVLEEEPDPTFLAGAIEPAVSPRVRIVRYSPDRVEIEADLDANGWLVLTDAWYPGWRARVDGSEAVIARADYLFRGVALRPGNHRVEFDYQPRGFSLGLFCTLAGAAAVATGIVLTGRKRKGKGRAS